MPLDTLIERIQHEARQEADAILKSAQTEADAIIDRKKEAGRAEAARIAEKSERDCKREREKILAAAKREARMFLTHAKEELIARCIEEVRQKLGALKGTVYRDYVERRIARALGDDDAAGYEIAATRTEDAEVANKFGLAVAETAEGLGGVVLRTTDRLVEIDLTFEFLLEQKREDMRRVIAQKLMEHHD
jgi:vacuolar-type H+-ATPase subunit E/Vma4